MSRSLHEMFLFFPHYISIFKLKILWINDHEKEFHIVKARVRQKKSNDGALKKYLKMI